MSILTQVLEKMHTSLSLAAQLYVKARLRPITYIDKFIDPAWAWFLFTPPHPEFPAAHAFITSATFEAIASVPGKNFASTGHTYNFNGLGSRSYSVLAESSVGPATKHKLKRSLHGNRKNVKWWFIRLVQIWCVPLRTQPLAPL